MIKKYINGIIVTLLVVILIILVGMAVGGNSSQSFNLGAANRLPHGYWDTADGYYVDGSAVINGSGEVSGSITGTVSGVINSEVAASVGKFTQGGGISTISTTSATYTMTQAELTAGSVISIADTGTAALALTLPASSTWTTIIPTAGDSREWWIQNLHTVAATTTTITTGVGIELQGIAAGDDIIDGAVWGKLTCFRQASTDIVCLVNEYLAAD